MMMIHAYVYTTMCEQYVLNSSLVPLCVPFVVMTGAVSIFGGEGDTISISESAFKGNSALGNQDILSPALGRVGMTCFDLIYI